MYCNKLINIVHLAKDDIFDINEIVIKKLDIFIKEKTTIKERQKLNPYKFSIEMKITQEIALKTFITGAKNKLFDPLFYYSCDCGDQFEVLDVNKEKECTCGKNIIPKNERSRLYIYFKLLEQPTPCAWEEEKDTYPLDFLESEGFGTENFTLADVDRIVGSTLTKDLISIKQEREENYKNFLKGEDGFATS